MKCGLGVTGAEATDACVCQGPPPTQVAAFHPDLSNSGNGEHQGDPRDSGDNTAWLSLPARTPRTPVGGPRWGRCRRCIRLLSSAPDKPPEEGWGDDESDDTPSAHCMLGSCWASPPVSRVETLMQVTQCRVQLGMEPGLD